MRQKRNSYFSFASERREQNRFSGFTIIELLVVSAIILIITSIVFASQSSFNKTLILTNTAYDIALSLRSAETYGLGTRAVGGVTRTGYGLSFQASTPETFTFFADTAPGPDDDNCHGLPAAGAGAPDAKPGDCVYTVGEDVKVTDYVLGNGIVVSDFCALKAGGSWSCAQSNGNSLTSLDIVFARPNAQPFMSVNHEHLQSSQVIEACLVILSPQGGARFLSIALSGAITVNAPVCPP